MHDELIARLRGRAAWYDDAHPGTVKTPELLREAAEAIAALRDQPVGVKVRGLIWERDETTKDWRAETVFGPYWAWQSGYFIAPEDHFGKPSRGSDYAAAKAGAEDHYRRRILSTLEPAALSRQEAAPVAWLDDGSLRAGSERTAHRVVTDEQKRDMPKAVRSSFNVPLYASPVPAEPSAEGWRPIETAPKDGSLFLAWNKTVGAVVASIPASTAHYKKIEVNVNGSRAFIRPTHWLPLPPAPHGEGA